VTVPEHGFTSKILSSKKKKKFMPSTPAKKSTKHRSVLPPGARHLSGSGSTDDQSDIFSPTAHKLFFLDEPDSQGDIKTLIKACNLKPNRLQTDFDILAKLGEGSFGEAFKVRERLTGALYAIKKAKERYLGYKDRE